MFPVVGRLRNLLSDRNVVYLDELLTALIEKEGSPVYDQLWTWFAKRFPNIPDAPNQAWGALRALHSIVKDYRKGRKI